MNTNLHAAELVAATLGRGEAAVARERLAGGGARPRFRVARWRLGAGRERRDSEARGRDEAVARARRDGGEAHAAQRVATAAGAVMQLRGHPHDARIAAQRLINGRRVE